ncbi:MAG TPA: signal recognition particle-docking protein FtsY [Blastocatellia bacterium]|nr:signal recognition particle-docking protein FtsY [Blastocatellia bacterium]
MGLFWKRKKQDDYITLGLNRAATPEEEAIARQPLDEPGENLLDKFKGAIAATRENLTGRIGAVIGGKRQIDTDTLDQLEEALIGADIGVQTAMEIIEKARLQVRGNQLSDVDALLDLIKGEIRTILESAGRNRKQGLVASETEVSLDIKPYIMMIVGVNGVGKTTTIGKLAHRIKSEGNEVMICAADTFRAAANDQLAIWAERSGVTLIQQKPGTDPSAVLFDSIRASQARGADVLIVDTAGRLHTKVNLMQELEKMRRVAGREVEGGPHEVLLVIDAVTGQNGLEQARQFTRAVPVTGLVLTKLDGTAKGGIVVAIAKELGIPIRYVGLGEKMLDLVEFSPEAYVQGLLG